MNPEFVFCLCLNRLTGSHFMPPELVTTFGSLGYEERDSNVAHVCLHRRF